MQHFEAWGFSSIQGMLWDSKYFTKSKAALKQALPALTLSTSFSLISSYAMPHGSAAVRITAVRSRAGEKLLHGGPSMAEINNCLWQSCLIRFRTAGLVKSQFSPCSSSHSLEVKPNLRTALLTPPCPEKKSPTYLRLSSIGRWEAGACLTGRPLPPPRRPNNRSVLLWAASRSRLPVVRVSRNAACF